MTTMYGFYVTRANIGQSKTPVWAGTTIESREYHKKWILENCSDPTLDGETTFVDVESEVIINATGYYIDNLSRIVRIQIVGGRDAYGYVQKLTKSGMLKDNTKLGYWFWLNGEASNGVFKLVDKY